MTVKYATVSPIVFQTFPAQSSGAALVTVLVGAFVAAGWTKSTISNGYQLSTASPQGFTVKLNITNLGSDAHIALQMIGSVNGYTHKLAWEPTLANNIPPYSYQIVVSPCGFFISRPGVQYDPDGSSLCGGIPFVAGNCGVGSNPTEVWFAFGDYGNNAFFPNMNPRIAIDVGGGGGFYFGSQEGCYDGTLYNLTSWNAPEILRISSVWTGSGVTLWADGADLLYEPLLAFPSSAGQDIEIRGQVYNAAVRSSETAMDTTRSWDGYDWMNYTNNYNQGSLWVMTGEELDSTVNYAY